MEQENLINKLALASIMLVRNSAVIPLCSRLTLSKGFWTNTRKRVVNPIKKWYLKSLWSESCVPYSIWQPPPRGNLISLTSAYSLSYAGVILLFWDTRLMPNLIYLIVRWVLPTLSVMTFGSIRNYFLWLWNSSSFYYSVLLKKAQTTSIWRPG